MALNIQPTFLNMLHMSFTVMKPQPLSQPQVHLQATPLEQFPESHYIAEQSAFKVLMTMSPIILGQTVMLKQA
jgi:hypothetical protein